MFIIKMESNLKVDYVDLTKLKDKVIRLVEDGSIESGNHQIEIYNKIFIIELDVWYTKLIQREVFDCPYSEEKVYNYELCLLEVLNNF